MAEDSRTATPWTIPFYINAVMLFMLVISFPYLDPGSASYTVALLSLGLVLFSLVLFGAIIRFNWTPFPQA